MSLSLFIQKVVRIVRPFQFPDGTWKEKALIFDMGDNASHTGGNMGDCNKDQPWQEFFDNPDIPSSKLGVGGCKICPNCRTSNGTSARYCQGYILDWLSEESVECGYIFPATEKEEDAIPRQMVKYFNDSIDIRKNIEYFMEQQGKSSGQVYYIIIEQVSKLAKKTYHDKVYLDEEQIKFFIDLAVAKVKEFSKLTTKKKTFKESVSDELIKCLQKEGFIININELV